MNPLFVVYSLRASYTHFLQVELKWLPESCHHPWHPWNPWTGSQTQSSPCGSGSCSEQRSILHHTTPGARCFGFLPCSAGESQSLCVNSKISRLKSSESPIKIAGEVPIGGDPPIPEPGSSPLWIRANSSPPFWGSFVLWILKESFKADLRHKYMKHWDKSNWVSTFNQQIATGFTNLPS